MLLLLPFFAFLFILAFWGIVTLFKKYSKENFTRRIYVSTIIVIYLAHPTLTSNAFSMMNCFEIEPGETWLEANL